MDYNDMEKINFNELIGKTIINVIQKKLIDYDDKGFLELKFNDGTKVIIVAEYGGYTGWSRDEYPTKIYAVKKYCEKLENI